MTRRGFLAGLLAGLLLLAQPGAGHIIIESGAVGSDPATTWTNLTMLLDEDLDVLTDIDGVFEHTDQSGAGNDVVQATGSKKPDVTANGIEGDAVDDILTGPSIGPIVPQAGHSGVVVMTAISVSTDVAEGSFFNNDSLLMDTGGFWSLSFRSSNKVQFCAFAAAGFCAEAAYTIGNEVVIGFYYDNTDLAVRVNGAAWVKRASAQRGSVGATLRLLGNFNGSDAMAYRYVAFSSDFLGEPLLEDSMLHLGDRFGIF